MMKRKCLRTAHRGIVVIYVFLADARGCSQIFLCLDIKVMPANNALNLRVSHEPLRDGISERR